MPEPEMMSTTGAAASEVASQPGAPAPGASLVGAQMPNQDLSGRDLSGCDLSGANLEGADLREARLAGAILRDAHLAGARLERVHAVGADFTGADLTEVEGAGAVLGGADLTEVVAFGADLRGANLSHATLVRADIRVANLSGARLREANLTGADLSRAEMRDADLTRAVVDQAHFREANLAGSRLKGMVGYATADWIGVDVLGADYAGAYLARRVIMDQNYLHEFRHQSRLNAFIYRLWWLTSDCGRSFLRWGLWTALVGLLFALVYTFVPVDFGPNPTPLSPVYFSVVTLTTLGYGDVLPVSAGAQLLVMGEVVLGYVMLGGLLSIFATKMGRRAE